MGNLVSILGTKLINLMTITTVEDTDYLIVQKDTNGDQFTRKILWSKVVDQLIQQSDEFITVSADYTVLLTDGMINVDASAAPVTISLPAAADANRKEFTTKKIDATGNNVTISASSTIDGSPTVITNTQWTSITVKSNGSGWFIK